ncbi:MAG TPA: glycosyltransferase [Candidatus Portnoybacteria bacterium]|nr:glycosyltransferase [Candidatus Portnoybacteria bacterium]
MSSYLEKIKTQPQDLNRYQDLTPEIIKECFLLAKNIQGLKILHINSTSNGGGVAELLRTQIPLEKSLGLKSSWLTIKAPEKFFKTTKKIHNLLQGEEGSLTEEEKEIYQNWLQKKIGPRFLEIIQEEKPQIVIIHDPQPLPLIEFIPQNIFSILRIHIDLSMPNKSTLDFLRPWMEKYQLGIFTHPNYRPKWWPIEKAKFIAPAINPFTNKNKLMVLSQAQKILNSFQVKTDQPIISQISRFDPWKDQISTIEGYYLAKNKVSSLKLVLVGSCQTDDDPGAKLIFEKIKKEVQSDPNIFLFSDSDSSFINAVYTASQIIIQKSIREGFGLTITEAMWKGKPVIGGKTTGIEMQIEDGKNGFLVSDAQEMSEKIILLLKNLSLQEKIGHAAHQTVQDKFLFPKLILEHLKIYTSSSL